MLYGLSIMHNTYQHNLQTDVTSTDKEQPKKPPSYTCRRRVSALKQLHSPEVCSRKYLFNVFHPALLEQGKLQ